MTNIESLTFFVPELVLCGTAMVLLCLAAVPRIKSGFASWIALAGLMASLLFAGIPHEAVNPSLFMNMLVLDRPAAFFRFIFVITAIAVTLFSQRSRELADAENPDDPDGRKDDYEYYALILGVIVGANLLAQARNVLMIYLALEFVGLTSYLLVGYARNSVRSSEAALKYVLYGAVASGIFLFGASIFYGLTGSLDVAAPSQISPAFVASGLFMLAGFLFKIAAVPMHAWCPDAYEGAPTPITALLSVVPKAAGFAVLMRVFGSIGVELSWPVLIAAISALTMTFGNLAAIVQTNAKRLLAYSSIAHAGYLLMGVACANAKGYEAVYFYFIAYLIMNLGAFLVVQIVANRTGSDDIAAFAGVGRSGPYGTLVAIAMTAFLLSLTGVPPFVGFIGKFYVFAAVVDAKIWWLAIVGIINSVVSLYYYMRIVKAMFFEAAPEEYAFAVEGKGLALCLVAFTVAVIFFGLAWSGLARIAHAVIA